MALDESLALCQAAGESPCTLRLYGWDPPAVSIGRFQDLYSEIDYLSCRSHGFDVVRRPTGGKAILHLDDVTYSVVMPLSSSNPADAHELFIHVANAALSAFRELGIEAEITVHKPDTSDPWCFTRPFGVDISTCGRKICGSAHRVYPGAFMQHGTLFLEAPKRVLPNLAPGGCSEDRTRWFNNFRKKVISLSEAAGRSVSRTEVLRAFKKGFEQYFQTECFEGRPNKKELDLASRLHTSTYTSGFWLFHRKRDTSIISSIPIRAGTQPMTLGRL